MRDGVDEAEDEELLAKDETALALLMLNAEPLYRTPQHDVKLLERAEVPWYFSRGHEFDSRCGRSCFGYGF